MKTFICCSGCRNIDIVFENQFVHRRRCHFLNISLFKSQLPLNQSISTKGLIASFTNPSFASLVVKKSCN